MNIIEALLRNKEFAASLLNGPCPSKKDKNDYTPINPDWINEKASDTVTEAFHKLLPSNFPYISVDGWGERCCSPLLKRVTAGLHLRLASSTITAM